MFAPAREAALLLSAGASRAALPAGLAAADVCEESSQPVTTSASTAAPSATKKGVRECIASAGSSGSEPSTAPSSVLRGRSLGEGGIGTGIELTGDRRELAGG